MPLTVLLSDAGEEDGRALAHRLAAAGMRLMLAGASERAVAETVGEVAYGGGTARLFAGDGGADHAAAAALRAREVFGALDAVVITTRALEPFARAAAAASGARAVSAEARAAEEVVAALLDSSA